MGTQDSDGPMLRWWFLAIAGGTVWGTLLMGIALWALWPKERRGAGERFSEVAGATLPAASSDLTPALPRAAVSASPAGGSSSAPLEAVSGPDSSSARGLASPPGSSAARPPSVADAGPPKPDTSAGPAELRYRWQDGRTYSYFYSVSITDDYAVRSVFGSTRFSSTAIRGPLPEPFESSGTAFVVADGLLLTCAHVVEDTTEIRVTLGGRTTVAELVAADENHDLAILRAKTDGVEPLKLADSDRVELAEEVRAIGFPLSELLGTNVKVTQGSVAGILKEKGSTTFQIDADLNPGNSGGPVVNDRGDVVAVASAGLFGFAIADVGLSVAINEAKPLLRKHGVPFAAGAGTEKLPGPVLAKRVVPAVAYVQCKHKPLGADRFALTYEATLRADVLKKSPGGYQTPPTTLGEQLRGRLVTDAWGEVHSDSGTHVLPFGLGTPGALIVDPLPPGNESRWELTRSSFVAVPLPGDSQKDVPSLDRSRSPTPPLYVPPGQRTIAPPRRSYSPPSRVPPPLLPGDRYQRYEDPATGQREPPVQLIILPSQYRARYELGERSGRLVAIKKYVELKTEEKGGVRFEWSGEGAVQFDVEAGVPESMELTLELRLTPGNVTVPMKVLWRPSAEPKRPPAVAATGPAASSGGEPRVPSRVPSRVPTPPEPKDEPPKSASPTPVRPSRTRDADERVSPHEYRRFPDMGWGVKSLAFSAKGTWLAVGKTDRAVWLFDWEKSTHTKVEKLENLVQVQAVAFTPDARKLLTGGSGGRIQVWDVSPTGGLKEANRFVGHTEGILGIAVSPDGREVLSCDAVGRVRCWTLETGRERFVMELADRLTACWISADGKTALATDGRKLLHIDMASGETPRTFALDSHLGHSLAISPDGRRVAFGSQVWETRDGKAHPPLAEGGIQWSLAFAPNSRYLLMGGSGKVSLWDIDARQRLEEFDTAGTYYVQTIACSHDGRYLAAIPGSAGQSLQVFRLPDYVAASDAAVVSPGPAADRAR